MARVRASTSQAPAVRVVVIVTECLTPIREWCNLSLVETKQPTEIAHMRIELSADELLKITIALNNESIRLLDRHGQLPELSPEQDEVWNKYLEVSGLGRKVSEAYRKADKKERLERSYPKVA